MQVHEKFFLSDAQFFRFKDKVFTLLGVRILSAALISKHTWTQVAREVGLDPEESLHPRWLKNRNSNALSENFHDSF